MDTSFFEIKDGVLKRRRSISGEFEIPYGVTSIEPMAFYGFTGLNRVVIPKTVKAIGFSAFEGCS